MITAKKMYLTSTLALGLALAGCSSDSNDTAPMTEKPGATSAPHSMQMGDQINESALTGTIVETFNSAGYTYMQIDNGQDTIWVAITQTEVAVGQEISLATGPVMKDFHSPSLNRTFEEIVFSSGVKGGAMTSPHGSMTAAATGNPEDDFMAALKAGDNAAAMAEAPASGGSTKAVVSAQAIQVDKAEGESGRTVEQVFAEADSLNGQKIQVRGKVVKVSPQIMGVNWLHLQDGSGNPAQKSHDLVVTTDEMAEEGAVILIEGTVAAKKDFGMGYFYEALVENAVISK